MSSNNTSTGLTMKLAPTVRFLFINTEKNKAVTTCIYGDDEGFSDVLQQFFDQGYTEALMHWRGHYYYCEPNSRGSWLRHQADDSHPWIPTLEATFRTEVTPDVVTV